MISDLAGWAQAVASVIAIFGTGYYTLKTVRLERQLDRQDESRRRLSVATTRWAPGGLQLDFHYRPEFTHIGIVAKVTLMKPAEAVLQQLRWVHSPMSVDGNFAKLEQGGPFVGNKGQVRLVRFTPDQPFTGSLLIRPSDYASAPLEAARIGVRIETTAGEKLLEVEMDVSPVDELQFPSEGQPTGELPPGLKIDLAVAAAYPGT